MAAKHTAENWLPSICVGRMCLPPDECLRPPTSQKASAADIMLSVGLCVRTAIVDRANAPGCTTDEAAGTTAAKRVQGNQTRIGNRRRQVSQGGEKVSCMLQEPAGPAPQIAGRPHLPGCKGKGLAGRPDPNGPLSHAWQGPQGYVLGPCTITKPSAAGHLLGRFSSWQTATAST